MNSGRRLLYGQKLITKRKTFNIREIHGGKRKFKLGEEEKHLVFNGSFPFFNNAEFC